MVPRVRKVCWLNCRFSGFFLIDTPVLKLKRFLVSWSGLESGPVANPINWTCLLTCPDGKILLRVVYQKQNFRCSKEHETSTSKKKGTWKDKIKSHNSQPSLSLIWRTEIPKSIQKLHYIFYHAHKCFGLVRDLSCTKRERGSAGI